jgi:hypothetical protein
MIETHFADLLQHGVDHHTANGQVLPAITTEVNEWGYLLVNQDVEQQLDLVDEHDVLARPESIRA